MTSPRRTKRLPHQQQPDAVRLSYYSYLKGQLEFTHQLVKNRVIAVLPSLLTRPTADHLDAAPQHVINRQIANIRTIVTNRFPVHAQQSVLTNFAARASSHQKQQLGNQLKAALRIDPTALPEKGINRKIDQFTAENVSLIKSLPEQYLTQVEGVVLKGMSEGARAEDLADDIEERFGVAKSRALLIARDQIGKFVGDLNKTRQTDLGITRFIWRTAHDQRVREEHAEREGEVFTWEDGAETDDEEGEDDPFPGGAINCRCWAEPVTEDLTENEEDE